MNKDKIIAKQKELIKNLTNQIFFGEPTTHIKAIEFQGLFDKESKLRNELQALESESDKELFEKIYIRDEKDLPEEDSDYIVHSKSYRWTGLTNWKKYENANYPEYNQYIWLLNYDWYLKPLMQ